MKIAYLDIETDYVGMFTDQQLFRDHKNHRITVLGVRVLQEDKDSFLQLVGKDVSKVAVLSALIGIDLIETYNGRSIPDRVKGYTGFDFPVIAWQLGLVLDKQFKHLDLCPVCWQHGLWGGQKAIERSLGLRRKLPGRDGAWAAITWKRYESTGDENFLKDLLEYNREDVFMLGRIEAALQMRPSSTHLTRGFDPSTWSCGEKDSDWRSVTLEALKSISTGMKSVNVLGRCLRHRRRPESSSSVWSRCLVLRASLSHGQTIGTSNL